MGAVAQQLAGVGALDLPLAFLRPGAQARQTHSGHLLAPGHLGQRHAVGVGGVGAPGRVAQGRQRAGVQARGLLFLARAGGWQGAGLWLETGVPCSLAQGANLRKQAGSAAR